MPFLNILGVGGSANNNNAIKKEEVTEDDDDLPEQLKIRPKSLPALTAVKQKRWLFTTCKEPLVSQAVKNKDCEPDETDVITGAVKMLDKPSTVTPDYLIRYLSAGPEDCLAPESRHLVATLAEDLFVLQCKKNLLQRKEQDVMYT